MFKKPTFLMFSLCAVFSVQVFAIDSDSDGVSDAEEIFVSTDVADPAQRPYWKKTVNGENAWGDFGAAVDFIGDVNGDGFSDYIVGAPYDNLLGVYAGSVTVFSGVDHSQLYKVYGVNDGEEFGWEVSQAGDVNDDGTPDFLVAAPSGGTVSVFSGADAALLTVFDSSLGLGKFGSGISAAGDFNGDGIDDLALSTFEPGVADSLFIFSGGDWSQLKKISFSSGVGSIAVAGDLNADNVTDFFVGLPWADGLSNGSGLVVFVSGADGNILQTVLGDQANSEFGLYLDGSADVNQDGVADLIVGSPSDSSKAQHNQNAKYNGKAVIYSGKDGSLVHELYGSAGSYFGGSVSYIDDLNQDGFLDIAVGASGKNSVRLFSGKDFEEIYYLYGSGLEGFGSAIAGSSQGEIVVGAFLANTLNGDESGAIRVFSAQDLRNDSNLDYVVDGESPVSIVQMPVKIDEDSDGLDNEKERLLGTDPYLLDTDLDGFIDGVGSVGDIPLSYSFKMVYHGTLLDGSADCEIIINNPPSVVLMGTTYSFVLDTAANDSRCSSSSVTHINAESFAFGPFASVGPQVINTRAGCSFLFGGFCGPGNPIVIQVGSISSIVDADSDLDGVFDVDDDLPLDASDSLDTDRDGTGDATDQFPNNPSEILDSDLDGVGDNADAFPNDATESRDRDGDGVGDNADAFPNDALETIDTDGDGVGDNADAYPNNAQASSLKTNDGGGSFPMSLFLILGGLFLYRIRRAV